ncbi:MAG: segregation/condensation protein A [Phycisphaerales bacterium]|nr:segregation/condensation protein A [Phycisphaerales bacterium]
MAEYKVELDAYNGPMDLLLYLIRRSEVDIYDIPIAQITEQYVAYVTLLQNLDPDVAGDFLVLAATLMEIKSRTLLPRPPVEEDEEDDLSDPRLELVRQLLEYKKFKDAARELDAAMQLQALKHQRVPVTPVLDSGEVDLDEVQVWDLLSAFEKLLAATGRRNRKHEVLYDDTPIALHAADILDALERDGGSRRFQTLFEGRTKSQMIGLFLAMLELIRQKRVRAVQPGEFAPIELQLLNAEPILVDETRDYRSVVDDDADADGAADAEATVVVDETEAEESADVFDDMPEIIDEVDIAEAEQSEPRP